MLRREFIGALAVGMRPLAAQAPPSEVRKLVDMHHHVLSPAMLAKRRDLGQDNLADWTPARSIELMDKNGVTAAVVSVSTPGIWFGKADEASRLARATNEFSARMVSDHPRRFGFFAALALPDVAGSLKEIEFSLDSLKADGVGLLSSYSGRYLGDPAFAPVFDELHRRKAIVHIHPAEPECCMNILRAVPPSVVEFGFDTTRTLVSLLQSGILRRCPDITFILAQGGGTLPFLAGRITRAMRTPMEQLGRLYFDTTSVTNAPAMAAMLKLVPPTHLLFGSDYPNATADTYARHVSGLKELVESGVLKQSDVAGIQYDNAARLFPRLRAELA